MIHLLLLASLFHPSHRSQFIAETMTELKHAAAVVGNYRSNPPRLTYSLDNAMYVTRGETDIATAMYALLKYKHHHASEQDVRTAVLQLERDLEDIPLANFPPDKRSTI